MQKLRMFRQLMLEDLKAKIPKNIDAYIDADTNGFPNQDSVSFEIEIEADLEKLELLRPTNSHDDEVFNSQLVFRVFENITPELARDERLWAYVTHYHALKYASQRWPIKKDSEAAHRFINSHFFAQTKRNVERDNAISRLWWMAFIAKKATTGTLFENLDAFLRFSDVRANIIERPTTGRSRKVLSAVLVKLRAANEEYKKDKNSKGLFDRATFRKFMSEVNALGGYVLLDALPEKKIDDAFSELAVEASKE